MELSEEIPGFAGYYYEGATRVVLLTDAGKQDHALTVLDARKQPAPSAHPEAQVGGGTRFEEAMYDYPTLRAWRDGAAEGVLNVDGVAWLDLDEARNRITVGIVDEKARPDVEAQLTLARVPLEAAIIEKSGAIEQDQLWLWNRRRLLQGGWQIQNQNLNLPCTLGFITYNPAAPSIPAFVTAAHCTPTMWGLDGINFYQPVGTAINDYVGREVKDPAGWYCGWLWRCRRSDAALVQVAVPHTNVAPGEIARPDWFAWGWNDGSKWVPAPPAPTTLFIGGYVNYPAQGTFVDKIGRQTGWNYQYVPQSCVTMNVTSGPLPWKRLLCQYAAGHKSQAGDSGAPVFIWYGNTVSLTGVTWGHNNAQPLSYFSPIGGIRADLGVP